MGFCLYTWSLTFAKAFNSAFVVFGLTFQMCLFAYLHACSLCLFTDLLNNLCVRDHLCKQYICVKQRLWASV